jgi:hypothetical protein
MKIVIRDSWHATRGTLRLWALKKLRMIVWAADEWLHKQELQMRQDAARKEHLAEVDPAASAARERVSKKSAHKPRARRPRLVYQGGQFVRRES